MNFPMSPPTISFRRCSQCPRSRKQSDAWGGNQLGFGGYQVYDIDGKVLVLQ